MAMANGGALGMVAWYGSVRFGFGAGFGSVLHASGTRAKNSLSTTGGIFRKMKTSL